MPESPRAKLHRLTTPDQSKKLKSHSGFAKAVALLVGGTAIGHGITAAVLPVLSRLYTPADFSVLAVFSGLLSIVAGAACLRFDVAVAIPERDNDALNLLALAVFCAAAVSAVLLLFVLAAPGWLASQLNQPRLEPYLWLLPLGVLLAGTYSALQCWFVRKRAFSLIARSRVAQSAASAGAQLGMGVMAIAPLGLLVGYVLNTGAACIGLGYKFIREVQRGAGKGSVSWPGMKAMFKAYDRFPKYSTFEALCNSAAIQLPVIMIAAMAAGPEAGYLVLAMSVMQAPMALFGAAIGQVYLSRAPEEQRAGRLGPFTAEVVAGLFKTGVGPLLAAGIVAPVAFGLIFGGGWERAGWLVAWMTPWFIMQFLASPISMALHVTGHQRAALMLQVFGLIVRVLAVWAAALWAAPLGEAYALSGLVFYLAYLLLVLVVVQASAKQIAQGLLHSLPLTATWTVGALTTVWILNRMVGVTA